MCVVFEHFLLVVQLSWYMLLVIQYILVRCETLKEIVIDFSALGWEHAEIDDEPFHFGYSFTLDSKFL